MKNIKRLLAMLLAVVMLLAMVACNDTTTPTEPTNNNTPTDPKPSENVTDPTDPEVVKPDLGGLQVLIANWWDNPETVPGEPTTAWAQLVYDYRQELMEEMNFSYANVGLSGTGDYMDVLVAAMLENNMNFNGFQVSVEQTPLTALVSQGLLWDLNELEGWNLDDANVWSQTIIDYFTIGGKTYAARPGMDEPRDGIVFNKKMLADAGLDPDLPYKLLQEGKWNWENFEMILEKTTKDSNNDGVVDVYGIVGGDNIIDMGIYTNGAMFVSKDEEGFLVDGTLDPAFQQGCEWALSLYTRGWAGKPSEGWDGAFCDFRDGKAAMVICQTWVFSKYYEGMTDDYGYIVLPAGPNGTNCCVMGPTPIAIPTNIDKDTASKIGQAIYHYNNTSVIEGAEDFGKTYLDSYYKLFRDTEAVELTIDKMMTDPTCQVYDCRYLVPNFNYYNLVGPIHRQEKSVQQAIEDVRAYNQSMIDAANTLFGKPVS